MATDRILEKFELTENSWETNALDAKFYGFSLAEYTTEIDKSRHARELVAQCKQQLQAANNLLKDTDRKNTVLTNNVAKSIAGDENFGDDSALYEGTGRVRRSERRRGLRRPRKNMNNNG